MGYTLKINKLIQENSDFRHIYEAFNWTFHDQQRQLLLPNVETEDDYVIIRYQKKNSEIKCAKFPIRFIKMVL